jgi:WS/DGAT/MGAT family acyltransferase
MRQLTGHDASFLYSDSVHANSNVTIVQIYDQSTAPGGRVRFKSILAHIESRLHRSPVFRSKLLRVPFELDYPYWIEDEHFNLEHHVRHIALPKPGDWRQFCIQASRIHARALDLNRPLWEIYVVEGLDSFIDLPVGSFALLTKTHHAAFDLHSPSDITQVLHDTTRRPRKAEPPQPWFPPEPPSAIELTWRSAMHAVFSPWKLVGPLARLAPAAMTFAADVMRPHEQPTATRFNAVVSPHRVFDTRRFVLDEFERMGGLVDGATAHDAVLAVCAGGLRRHLSALGELPQGDLAAVVHCAFAGTSRSNTDQSELPSRRIQLGTHLADPLQRLAWIARQTSPPRAVAVNGSSAGHAAVATADGAQLASCTITDLPGPSVPLYLNGARMTYYSAILPISDGMGLVFSVTRYGGQVIVSPTSCRELLPDPEAFTQCVRDSYQEYLALTLPTAAASRRTRPAAPGASASDRRSPRPRKARTGATAPRVAKADPRRSTAPRR